ncbi:MAG: hypothetical protein Q9227_001153 [Pyrenula ochraceoflavens]
MGSIDHIQINDPGTTDPCWSWGKNYYEYPPAGIFAPREDDGKLSVGIIGAGIAGLSAAIGLSRSGHDIFERSRFNNETGAAISASPNAARVLRYWGFDFEKAQCTDMGHGRFMNGDDLSTYIFNDHSHWQKEYGERGYFFHRVDLHNGLKELAQHSPSTSEPAAKIRTSAAVEAIDPDTGKIILANGEEIKKDLIVVADGVHSEFVSVVSGESPPALSTGISVFRFMIPTEELLKDENTRPLFEGEPPGIRFAILGDTRLVFYPCRNEKIQNFAYVYPTSLLSSSSSPSTPTSPIDPASPTSTTSSTSTSTSSTSPSDSHLLLTTLTAATSANPRSSSPFHPSLLSIFSLATATTHSNNPSTTLSGGGVNVKHWPLLSRPPLHTYTRSLACLVGDAAHPMLPLQGQGGAMAIEDGALLGVVFSHFPKISDLEGRRKNREKEEVEKRLKLWQGMRVKRAGVIQIFSDRGQDLGAEGREEEVRRLILKTDDLRGDGKEEEEKEEVKVKVPRGPEEFHRWNFGWDCWREGVRGCLEGGVW